MKHSWFIEIFIILLNNSLWQLYIVAHQLNSLVISIALDISLILIYHYQSFPSLIWHLVKP
jgi:hypothetical protein